MTNIGKCVWFDLFTADVEKAKIFYSELFNWSTQEKDFGQGTYTMFVAGNTPVCGVEKAPHPAVNNMVLAYVSVESLDTAVAAIKNDGGEIIGKEDSIPQIGRWVVAKDAQGAIFAPFESAMNPAEAEQTPDQPPVGTFCWHELMCQDYQKSFDFYSNLFGWKKGEAIDMGPMGVYQVYNNPDNVSMGGMMNIVQGMPIQNSSWLEYVHVDNVDETAKRAIDLGGKPLYPARDINNGGGRIAGIVDNQGMNIAFWTPAK